MLYQTLLASSEESSNCWLLQQSARNPNKADGQRLNLSFSPATPPKSQLQIAYRNYKPWLAGKVQIRLLKREPRLFSQAKGSLKDCM